MGQEHLEVNLTTALMALQVIAPGTVVAGGYLRDLFFGKPVKDIDFFLPHEGATLENLRTVFPEAKLESYSEWLAYRNEEVDAIYDLGLIDGLPAQGIVLREGMDPWARTERFDFGFCQIRTFYDGFAQATDAFYKDAAASTATLVHCESQSEFDRSMKRWKRLSKKYPELTLVIPEEFRQWATTSLT